MSYVIVMVTLLYDQPRVAATISLYTDINQVILTINPEEINEL